MKTKKFNKTRLRKWLWKTHSVLGVVCALGLLVIGLTGSVLVMHDDLDRVFRPEATKVQPLAQGKLPWSERVKAVEIAFPQHSVTGWSLQTEDMTAAEGAYVMPWGTREWHYLTVNPYTGEVLSGPKQSNRTFKHWILMLHYTLLLDHVGMAVTGVLGVMLCFLGISGLWIYRRFWILVFKMKWRASARLVWGNVHRLTGVLSVVFNLLLGFTGAYWNLSHVVEELLHPHTDPADEVLFYEKLYPDELKLDRLLKEAEDHIDGFVTHYVSMPWAPDGQFTLWGRTSDTGWLRSRYGSQVVFDAQKGAFLSAHDLRQDTIWKQIVDSFEPLHFGDFGGLPVKILYVFAGLAPGILAVSGIAIWWRRKRS